LKDLSDGNLLERGAEITKVRAERREPGSYVKESKCCGRSSDATAHQNPINLNSKRGKSDPLFL